MSPGIPADILPSSKYLCHVDLRAEPRFLYADIMLTRDGWTTRTLLYFARMHIKPDRTDKLSLRSRGHGNKLAGHTA